MTSRQILHNISLKFSKRLFHSTKCRQLSLKDVQEVKIPVPWGHIAGAWWGSKDVQPIISLHGWMDNAGTWEPLLKAMPKEYSFLAIDFPGGGYSSHLPNFHNYSFLDSIGLVRRIQRYYDMNDVVILGHSGGSATGFFFSSIFNNDVRGFFGIDFLLYAYRDNKKRADRMPEIIDRKLVLALREFKNSSTYTWEEAQKSWTQATKGSVSSESANILMKRGVTKLPDGKVLFSRDHRLKSPTIESISVNQALSFASKLTCPTVLIKASKSPFFDGGIKNCPEIMDIIKKTSKDFQFHTLEGGHHIHMDKPESISSLLLDFLKKI